jgi:serine/threonine-protein kinase
LGTGGMAAVFLARAEGMGGFERDVAVKLIHAHLRENQELTLALLNEARIAAKIRHPNVVPVYDVGEDPSGIFLVMEYVEGDTLSGLQRAARAANTRIPVSVGLRILADALAGLQGAHEQRDSNGAPLEIVHRDFSPQNILVGADGVSRLTDFGIAKAAGRSGHTSPGSIKGKVAYMAPEQARGKVVDRRCDVWAAGVVAWELLAARALHESDDEVATLLDVVTQAPPDLRTIDPSIPAALADVVASALVIDRQRRCPTAAELRSRLISACRAHGTLADSAEVATFMDKMGGGRTITPLPSEAMVAPALPVGGDRGPGRDSPTMTLQSIPINGGNLDSTGVELEPGAARANVRRRSWNWNRVGMGVVAVAVSAAGMAVLASRPIPRQAQAIVAGHEQAPGPAPRKISPPVAVAPALIPASAVFPAPATIAAAAGAPVPEMRALAPRRHHGKDHHGRELSLHTIHASIAVHGTHAGAPHAPSPPPLAGNPYADEHP